MSKIYIQSIATNKPRSAVELMLSLGERKKLIVEYSDQLDIPG